ncbi:MAG: hypothetical protein GXP41_00835 [Chloroflexi bacterium]|nr:hypothetical protein [Chloroflexota bacterium]
MRFFGKNETVDAQKTTYLLAAILLLAAALRLYTLGSESFWYDEAYSVAFAHRSLQELSLTHFAGLPFSDRNLYHLFLHFWIQLGEGDTFVRLPSALAGWSSVFLLYLLGKTLFDRAVGLWSAAFLAISPLHVWYSQEARMYIFASTFSLASVFFFARILKSANDRWNMDWVAMVVSACLALYAHYVAVLVVIFQNTYSLYHTSRRKLGWPFFRRWVLSQIAVFLVALLWLIGLLYQQRHGWWGWVARKYGPPHIGNLITLWQQFSVGVTFPDSHPWRLIAMLIFAVTLLSGAISPLLSYVKGTQGGEAPFDRSLFVVLYFLLPLVLAYAASQFTPMFITRYLIPLLPAYCLWLGLGIASIHIRWVQWPLALALVLLSFVSLLNLYQLPQKEDWRGAAAYVDSQVRPDDVIFLVDGDIFIPFNRYYRHVTDEQRVWRGLDDPQKLGELVDGAIVGHRRFWIVRSHAPDRALDYAFQRDPRLVQMDRRAYLGVEVSLFQVARRKT